MDEVVNAPDPVGAGIEAAVAEDTKAIGYRRYSRRKPVRHGVGVRHRRPGDQGRGSAPNSGGARRVTDSAAAEFHTLAEMDRKCSEHWATTSCPAGCARQRQSSGPGLAYRPTELHRRRNVAGLRSWRWRTGGVRRAAWRLPVLMNFRPGGCRAARTLFGLPALQADAAALPVADDAFDAAWALGVLCTTQDQLELLGELRRAVRPPGSHRATGTSGSGNASPGEPEDSFFPTASSLSELLQRAGLPVDAWRSAAENLGATAAVATAGGHGRLEMRARHDGDEAWQVAERRVQSHRPTPRGTPRLCRFVLSLRHRAIG